MAERVGREVKVYKGIARTLILGLREKGITAGGELLDITTDDSNGYRAFLAKYGQKQIDVSLSGLPTTDLVKNAFYAGLSGDNALDQWEIEWPNGARIIGQFAQENFVENESYNGATPVQFDLKSSGAWAFTPAP